MDTMSCPIFCQLFCEVCRFALSIYQLDTVNNNLLILANVSYSYFFQSTDSIEATIAGTSLLIALSYMFFLCHFATRVTDQNLNVASYVYQSEWYILESKYQKYCQLIMVRAQINLVFRGYKLISCTMEQFVSVLIKFECFNSCSSYYTQLIKFFFSC